MLAKIKNNKKIKEILLNIFKINLVYLPLS
ncbi:hypothetical protein SAMN05421823_108227 [Catalinimonas alkaloidigena]|uniref:Uncharacterized protein n=1 Tax=Catalinimonas alkaloidigena TaxID=1075417 RepID=A0A1G9NAG0_9BACT|nr:hypothetical protein SAMN05421823_108227 [Catalinimonas alkaloidigena]